MGEPFENKVGNPRGGADGEVERGGIGHAGAVGIGDGDLAGGGEFDELFADAVDEHDLDAEAAEHGDVDEKVPEILVGDDGSVDGEDEDLTLETRDVFQNPP